MSGRRGRRLGHPGWVAAGVAAGLLVLVSGVAAPSEAQGAVLGLPSPGKVVSGLLGGVGHVIGGGIGKAGVTVFDAIIHALFAPIARFINVQLLGWLVAVPDYARAGTHVAATEQTVLAMAGAAMGAVATITIARFWAAGLAGSGGAALEGLGRIVWAALMLPVWPWAFHTAIAIANAASTGLLGSGAVTKSSANLLALGVGAGVGLGFLGVGLFVSIVMAVVASVLFLGLLMMKVVLAVSTVLIFIGMPVAIVLSPVVPWILRVLARAFGVCLAVPLVWAVCFAASGALLNDGVLLKGSPGFFDALLKPLAAIALLWLMLSLPSKLAQLAMLGASSIGGGFVSRAVSYAAGSQLREASRQHLPGWAGGSRAGGVAHAGGSASQLGRRLREESVLAASKAAVSGAAGGPAAAAAAASSAATPGRAGARAKGGSAGSDAAGAAGGPTSNGGDRHGARRFARRSDAATRAYSPPPLARRRGALAAAGGLQQPSWRQQDFDSEMLEASLREQRQPVSLVQARSAVGSLPDPTRAAVGNLVRDHGPRARQHLAYQALGAWTPGQREAIRTLAAASPEIRAQAFPEPEPASNGSDDRNPEHPSDRGQDPRAQPSAVTAPMGDLGARTDGDPVVRTPRDQGSPESGGER